MSDEKDLQQGNRRRLAAEMVDPRDEPTDPGRAKRPRPELLGAAVGVALLLAGTGAVGSMVHGAGERLGAPRRGRRAGRGRRGRLRGALLHSRVQAGAAAGPQRVRPRGRRPAPRLPAGRREDLRVDHRRRLQRPLHAAEGSRGRADVRRRHGRARRRREEAPRRAVARPQGGALLLRRGARLTRRHDRQEPSPLAQAGQLGPLPPQGDVQRPGPREPGRAPAGSAASSRSSPATTATGPTPARGSAARPRPSTGAPSRHGSTAVCDARAPGGAPAAPRGVRRARRAPCPVVTERAGGRDRRRPRPRRPPPRRARHATRRRPRAPASSARGTATRRGARWPR